MPQESASLVPPPPPPAEAAGDAGVPAVYREKYRLHALPASSWLCLPVRARVPDERQGVQATRLELETLGLLEGGAPADQLDARARQGPEGATVITGMLLHGREPADAASAALTSRFLPACNFRRLAPLALELWSEEGQVRFTVSDAAGKIIHSQALTAATLDGDAYAEILCVLGAMDARGVLPRLKEVIWRGRKAPAGLDLLAHALALPGRALSDEWLPPQEVEGSLVPDALRARRESRRITRRWLLALGLLLLGAVIVPSLYAFSLYHRERLWRQRTEALKVDEPKVKAIRGIQTRWLDLEPAVNPLLYPQEQIQRLWQVLPTEGVRLTLLELTSATVTLAGEAANPALVGNLRDSLNSDPRLRDLKWDFPQPQILPDGRASFRIEGKKQ